LSLCFVADDRRAAKGLLSFQQRHLAQRLQLLLDCAGVADHNDDEVLGMDIAVRDIQHVILGNIFDITQPLVEPVEFDAAGRKKLLVRYAGLERDFF